MENAAPPVEGLLEEPQCRWKYFLLNPIAASSVPR